MRRTGFNLVEILIAMSILAILTSVTLVTYRGEQERTAEVVLRGRLRKFHDAIIRWQLEHRRPWYLPGAPEGRYKDPWGQPLQVDPRRAVIWSLGPDGEFRTPDEASAHSLSYEAYPTEPVGSPQRVQGRPSGGGGITLTWSWPDSQAAAIGYRVQKASKPGDTFQDIGDVLPGPRPSFTDPRVEPGRTYYYRVLALLGPGSKDAVSPPSRPYAVASPVSTNPILKLTSNAKSAPSGATLMVRVEGYPSGTPLAVLEFQGQSYPVGPGSFSMKLPVTCAAAGPLVIQAELKDTGGKAAEETYEVEVY